MNAPHTAPGLLGLICVKVGRMPIEPDPRHLLAVEANRRWYEATHAARGSRWRVDAGLWSCPDPPPWHSGVVALVPGLDPGRVARAAAEVEAEAVADDFADLDLGRHGRRLLFEATWIHHRPPGAAATTPPGWDRVADAELLRRWSVAHDYVGVLTPAMLHHDDLAVLARDDGDGEPAAGAVLHGTPAAVGISNVWSRADDVSWADLVALAADRFPGRPLVGYEHGADVDDALTAGFDAVGTHRVWVRTS